MREVVVKADTIKKRKIRAKKIKITVSIIFILLFIAFFILSIIYKGGSFTVTLDKNLALQKGIVLYDDSEQKDGKGKLYARDISFMDNISIDWLPKNINNEAEGAHNGDNYIAYTFYIENKGKDVINYWYSIVLDDVIKNVDEAVRVMIYLNDEKTVYAKTNAYTGKAEKDTKEFLVNEDKEIILENRNEFKVGDTDKFTIVIWLEGDDPDCVDAIIGGEIKMHMEIREEHLEGELSEEKKEK